MDSRHRWCIRNNIREGKTPQIQNYLASSAKDGNQTMDNCLIDLYKRGLISRNEAVEAAHDSEYVKKGCRGFGI